MTRPDDIERVLDQFYAEGPSEMPDRLFLGVIDRIERVPQRRLAFMTRFTNMNSNLRLAAAAAIVVAVVGVGAFALSQRSDVGPQATATVSPSLGATPGASLSPMPAALAYPWIGPPRTVPEITPSLDGALLLFDHSGGGTLSYDRLWHGYNTEMNNILSSTVGLPSPDTLVFALLGAENGCQKGDRGSYTFSLGPSGKTLALHAIADACAARSTAISGDWNRINDRTCACLGDMDPGAHVSAIFNPFVEPSAWVRNYGAFSYEVAAGWQNGADEDSNYFLTKQGTAEGGPQIVLWSGAAANSQDASCAPALEPGIGRTPAALASWLKGLPGVVATTPALITVGGLSGMTLDLSMKPTWTHSYCNSPNPSVRTLNELDVAGTTHERIILLDAGSGGTLLVEIDAPDKATFDAFVVDAMQVVNTFQFKP
jgi:hypothetical protein